MSDAQTPPSPRTESGWATLGRFAIAAAGVAFIAGAIWYVAKDTPHPEPLARRWR